MQYPRGGSASGWTGRAFVVWGDTIGNNGIPPHGEPYDPMSDTWSPMPRFSATGALRPIAVWTSVVFWGGQDARNWGRMHDGAAFTPASP